MFRKYFILLLSTLYIVVGVFAVFGGATDVASVKKGSSGDDVKKIQQRLSSWGYYKGDIDGVFGSATETAVKAFQKNNGLTADGVVGSATAAKIGISLSGSSGSSGNSGSSGGTNNSGMFTCWPGLSTERPAASPIRGRSPWGRWFSTGWRTRRFPIRLRA